jgi:acetyl-CoA carboxylase biotin carboxyl carrier protein
VSNRRTGSDWSGTDTLGENSLVEQIKLLAEAIAGSQVTELELVDDGLEITLKRSPQPVVPAAVSIPLATPRSNEPETPADMSLAVLAPLTGVFYISPSPTSPPYIQPGDTVQSGQVVCIVEAMKVFNEIKTEIGGIVVAIPPISGQLVKKGDPLVRIKPH